MAPAQYLSPRGSTIKQYDNMGLILTINTAWMCAISSVIVAFRVGLLIKGRKALEVDDWMATVAWGFNVMLTIFGAKAVANGFGLHGAEVLEYGGDLSKALLFWYLAQHACILVFAFNKLCFLTLYLRAFRSQQFRLACIVTIIVVASGTFAFEMVSVFQCTPIHKYWEKSTPGHCINNAADRWAFSTYNTAMDIWVCLSPVPVIWRIQMDLGKRIGLALVFVLGLFVCVTSIIRIHYLVSSVKSTDPTWGSLQAFLWGGVEASTGLICACLPSFKKCLSEFFPNISYRSRSRQSRNTFAMQRTRSGQWEGGMEGRDSVIFSGGSSNEQAPPGGILKRTSISITREDNVN